MTYCMDANAFIAPWNVLYRPNVFPTLWSEISAKRDQIVIIKPVFDEISTDASKDNPSLKDWLNENTLTATRIDESVEEKSTELEKNYEIGTENSKGANQNDMTLIAYAKENKMTVVTLEAIQHTPPKYKKNYKIPLICKEQEVDCIDFVTFLEEMEIKI